MREPRAYIALFLHFTLTACANDGMFHIEKGTMFTAQPFVKYTVGKASACAFKCLTDQPCIAFNYNSTSHECGLLDRNTGKIAILDHTVGVRGELINTFEPTVPVVNCSSDVCYL